MGFDSNNIPDPDDMSLPDSVTQGPKGEYYINLHTGNLWELTGGNGTTQEWTRLTDEVVFTGLQPQYFRPAGGLDD